MLCFGGDVGACFGAFRGEWPFSETNGAANAEARRRSFYLLPTLLLVARILSLPQLLRNVPEHGRVPGSPQ